MKTWALIPVKTLKDSKSRLARVLTEKERINLTRHLLVQLLDVIEKVPALDIALVVSSDMEVLELAQEHSALILSEKKQNGLNEALCQAKQYAHDHYCESILVLPCDLPFVQEEDIELFLSAAETQDSEPDDESAPDMRTMIISPDQSGKGTNALFLYPVSSFNFQFGPESFKRHLREAAHQGMTSRIVDPPGLTFDLDTEEDWITYQTTVRSQSEGEASR